MSKTVGEQYDRLTGLAAESSDVVKKIIQIQNSPVLESIEVVEFENFFQAVLHQMKTWEHLHGANVGTWEDLRRKTVDVMEADVFKVFENICKKHLIGRIDSSTLKAFYNDWSKYNQFQEKLMMMAVTETLKINLVLFYSAGDISLSNVVVNGVKTYLNHGNTVFLFKDLYNDPRTGSVLGITKKPK